MLSRDKRLNLKKDFRWVASGGRVEGTLVKLFFRFGSNKTAKVGISLSKAAFKKAVDRNRARRLISTGFEALYDSLPQQVNIVAIPKGEVLKLRSEEVKESLSELLQKLNNLK